jgi:hypothetical protein
MKKTMAFCVMVILFVACSDAHAKKKQVYKVPGGVPIAQLNLAIDASYDSRLDDFVPGYKVINVAMVNSGFRIIYLDPEKDRWAIKLAGRHKSINVIHDLRSKDPEAWHNIPDKAKGLVSYPLVLPIGAREVVDIFVPDTVDVTKFNELDVFLKSLDAKFEINVRQ